MEWQTNRWTERARNENTDKQAAELGDRPKRVN